MANPEAASIVEAAEKMQNAEGKEVTHFSYKHKCVRRVVAWPPYPREHACLV